MRPYRILVLYVGGVLVVGALLAPWVYWLVGGVAGIIPAAGPLAGYPFYRYVQRAFLLAAVVGLLPFLRALGIRSWQDLGLSARPGRARRLGEGVVLSFSVVAATAAVVLLAGARDVNTAASLPGLLRRLASAALTASAVAVLEELLFRGGIFGGLRRGDRWQRALWVSSFLYAILHFFGRPADPDVVTWSSGVQALGGMLAGFGNLDHLLPDLLNVAVIGALLAFAYQRTGDLFFSIGMHAGWIFAGVAYGTLTVAAPGVHIEYWGSGIFIDGWMALIALSLTSAVLVLRVPQAAPSERPGGDAIR